MPVLLVIFGLLAVIGGIFGKDFHAADIESLGEYKQKTSSRFGRVFFFLVGICLIGVGIKMLFKD